MIDREKLHYLEFVLRGVEENLKYWRSVGAVDLKAYKESYQEAKELRAKIRELRKKIEP